MDRDLSDRADGGRPVLALPGREAATRGRQREGRYSAWATLNWQLAAAGNIDEAALLRVGQEADDYLRKRGQ